MTSRASSPRPSTSPAPAAPARSTSTSPRTPSPAETAGARTRPTLDLPGFKPRFDGHPRQVKLAAKAIAAAERPVILAGHGVLIADATDELKTFAHKAQIPVTHTLLGVGAIDEDDPLSYGYMGMHGWKHVNKAIQSADLLIALGMRFDDRVTGSVSTYAPNARIIHVDIDPSEIGKNVAVDIPIVGDVGSVLRAFIKAVPEVDPADARGLLRRAGRSGARTPRPSRGTARAARRRACSPPTT